MGGGPGAMREAGRAAWRPRVSCMRPLPPPPHLPRLGRAAVGTRRARSLCWRLWPRGGRLRGGPRRGRGGCCCGRLLRHPCGPPGYARSAWAGWSNWGSALVQPGKTAACRLSSLPLLCRAAQTRGPGAAAELGDNVAGWVGPGVSTQARQPPQHSPKPLPAARQQPQQQQSPPRSIGAHSVPSAASQPVLGLGEPASSEAAPQGACWRHRPPSRRQDPPRQGRPIRPPAQRLHECVGQQELQLDATWDEAACQRALPGRPHLRAPPPLPECLPPPPPPLPATSAARQLNSALPARPSWLQARRISRALHGVSQQARGRWGQGQMRGAALPSGGGTQPVWAGSSRHMQAPPSSQAKAYRCSASRPLRRSGGAAAAAGWRHAWLSRK